MTNPQELSEDVVEAATRAAYDSDPCPAGQEGDPAILSWRRFCATYPEAAKTRRDLTRAILTSKPIADLIGEAVEGFASQMWGLSLLAQAELDNGDPDGAQKTLVRIAEAADEFIRARSPSPPNEDAAISHSLGNQSPP